MNDVDLNLLPALDALLTEGSVTGAARRLGLSTSAMSRTLARLRAMTGDPLLVRAGSGLEPTPRAIAMRDQVRDVALTHAPSSALWPPWPWPWPPPPMRPAGMSWPRARRSLRVRMWHPRLDAEPAHRWLRETFMTVCQGAIAS